jgi:hypothetical protein
MNMQMLGERQEKKKKKKNHNSNNGFNFYYCPLLKLTTNFIKTHRKKCNDMKGRMGLPSNR